MSESPVSTAPDSVPERAQAKAEALLHADERLLWHWDSRAGRHLSRRGEALLYLALTVGIAGYAAALWLYGDLSERRQQRIGWLALLGIALVPLALVRVAGRHRIADEVESWFGEAAPARTFALTQHRVLMLAETLQWEVPLEPGEPVIQYGSFRIDRPDRRGKPLIRRIPKDEQKRLFAALKLARAMREGRSATPA